MQTLFNNPLFIPIAVTIAVIAIFPLMAGYIVLIERKVLADFQVRLGPMRVGPHGLLQPLADAVKLLLKEDIIPTDADKAIFWFAPIISTFTALSAALRSAAQLVSYEVALSFALLSGLMVAGTLSMQGIIKAQQERHIWFVAENYCFMIVPFVVYIIAATAETNRAPFDLPEAESELVAGFHTEYSGFRFSLFFLAEYAAMIVISSMAVTLFWGGWLRPFSSIAALGFLDVIPGVAWFALKVVIFLYFYLWFRASWPRYRYDQLMKLGWQFLLPISMANVIATAILVVV